MKGKRELNGYMTVEAAMIMPIVWFVIFFVLFLGFFLYDRCIAEQDCKIILLQTSAMEEKNEAEIMRKIRERANLADKKKLLFTNSAEKELDVTDQKAKIKIKGVVPTVLHGLLKDDSYQAFAYSAEYETDRYDPVHFIRSCRRLGKYAEA